jgi:UDP-N-acetylmuramoylalanine--D-glutamate ligase
MPNSPEVEFYRKKILVVGMGVTGLWTARWLVGRGAAVTISDARNESEMDPGVCRELRAQGIRLETGGHRNETVMGSEMIVLSPGVPHDTALFRAAREMGIPVTGELELASRQIDTPMIAVTGTNGKSSVAAFLGTMLETAKLKVFVGGNIGTPLMAYVAGPQKADYVVVEVSSFQMDTIETFSPFVSMLLNISPDHLDRYPSYEDYVQSKLRIFMNQRAGQFVILNDDDERLSRVYPKHGVTVFRFGTEKKERRNAFIEAKTVFAGVLDRTHHRFSLDAFRLPGKHNMQNLMAAVLAGLTLNVDPGVIQKTIGEFRGLADRLEWVAECGGVAFYNDSKGTNVDAATQAIGSFERPIVLIAGGRHKGADYTPLAKAAEGRVRCAVFLGEARQMLAEAFEGVVPCSLCESMEDAVTSAFSQAQSGDVVLLSPACSSFDMFNDYYHRGRVFRAAVERLGRG